MDEETVLKTAGCKSLGGSIPSSSALAVAQLVRAPDCGSGGRGFDSHRSPICPDGVMVAALVLGTSVERRVGSSPTLGTNASVV